MDNTYTPLVSDEQLTRLKPFLITVDLETGEETDRVLMPMNAYEVRDLYENDRRQTHAELAELRAENERMKGSLDTMVSTLERVGRSTDQSASFRIGEALNIGYNAKSWEATRKPSQPSTKDTE